MQPPIDIRRLGAGDVADYRAIRLMALATAPRSFGSRHAEEAARPLADFADLLGTASVFGAFAGTTIVGVAGMTRETAPKRRHKGFVWGVFVDPARRGQGIAAALVTAMIEAARGEVEQLTLTVAADNADAVALYQRLGFATYGVEPRSLKEDDGYTDQVLMALRLTPD
jgi:ribosomal protein S18 acetylase RimI-like enzyme